MMMAQILEESLYDFLTQMSSAHVSSLYQLFFKEISAFVFLNFFLAAERYQEVMFLHSLSHLRWHFH